MADVFISYAKRDRARIASIAAALEQCGLSVWWDLQIGGGEIFSDKIERELNKASVVVVLWSASSIHSKWVTDEASYAVDHNKLIPIRIDDVAPPLGFRQYQALDFRDWPDETLTPALLKSINELATGLDIDAEATLPVARHSSFVVQSMRYMIRFTRWRMRGLATIAGIAVIVSGVFFVSNARVSALNAKVAVLSNSIITQQTEQVPWQTVAINDAMRSMVQDNMNENMPIISNLQAGNIEDAVVQLELLHDNQVEEGAPFEMQIATLKQIGALIFYSNTQKAIDTYKQVQDLDPQDPIVFNQLGNLYFRVNDPDLAYAYFVGVTEIVNQVPFFQRNKTLNRLEIAGNIGIGRTKIYHSQYDEAVRYLTDAQIDAEAIGARWEEAFALEKLGALEKSRGNNDESYRYYMRALVIAQSIGAKTIEASALDMMGAIALLKGELDDAQEKIERALVINRSFGRKKQETINLSGLGEIALKQNAIDDAKTHFQAGLEIADKHGFWRMRTLFHESLGEIAKREGDDQAACEAYRAALEVNNASPAPNPHDNERLEEALATGCA